MDEATYDLEKRRVDEYENKKRRLSAVKMWIEQIDKWGALPIVTLQDKKQAHNITVYDGYSTHSWVHAFVDREALRDYLIELLNNEVGKLEEDLAAV